MPGIALAQPIVDGVMATAQTPQATYGQNVTAGNSLLALVNWSSLVGNILSVMDSLNNKPFIQIGSVISQRARTQGFFYLPGTLGGVAPVVTANLDSAQNQAQLIILELTGYVVPDTPGFSTANGGGTTTPSGAPLTTTGASDFVLSMAGGISIATGPPGWTTHLTVGTVNRATAWLLNAAPGTYTATWTQASGSFLIGTIALMPSTAPVAGPFSTYMRALAKQNQILGGSGASTSDNEFTLMARNNKLLGGPMASTSDTIRSLISKQNRLLGGTGANTNENQFWLYVRILKLLGGTAYPSDTVNSLLRKINTLI